MEEELKAHIGSNLSVYVGESCFRGELLRVDDKLAAIRDQRVGEIYIALDKITAFHKDRQAPKGVGFV